MADEIEVERIDADIRARYPYPLAATFYRAFYDVPDLALVHDHVLDLFEIIVKYLSAIVLAQYVEDGGHDPALARSLESLRRPSLGHWLGWLRDILRYYARQQRPLRIPELAAFYEQRHTGEILRGYNALREMMAAQMDAAGAGKTPGAVTTQQFFDLLVEYRNKLAHGARLSVHDRERAVTWLMPAMRELLQGLAFLADYRLVYISEVQLATAAARRATHYEHYCTYLTGDRPRVSREPKSLEQVVAQPKQVYLLAKDPAFAPLLSLHPFLVYRYCEKCSTEQVFVLNTSRENLLTYLSYQCAHQFNLTEYVDDIGEVLRTVGAPDTPEPLFAATSAGEPATGVEPEDAAAPPLMPAADLARAPVVPFSPVVPSLQAPVAPAAAPTPGPVYPPLVAPIPQAGAGPGPGTPAPAPAQVVGPGPAGPGPGGVPAPPVVAPGPGPGIMPPAASGPPRLAGGLPVPTPAGPYPSPAGAGTPARRGPLIPILVGLALLGLGIVLVLVILQLQATQRAQAGATATAVAAIATQEAAAMATEAAISAQVTAEAQATATAQAFATAEDAAWAPVAQMHDLEQLAVARRDGSLPSTTDKKIISDGAGVTLRDFVTEATFTNPSAASSHSWDYGFVFRATAPNQQFRLVVTSGAHWYLDLGPNDTGQEGSITHLNVGAGETNILTLYVQDTRGYFIVNDYRVAILDLSQKMDAGDIAVATDLFTDDEVEGATVKFEGFGVWSLP